MILIICKLPNVTFHACPCHFVSINMLLSTHRTNKICISISGTEIKWNRFVPICVKHHYYYFGISIYIEWFLTFILPINFLQFFFFLSSLFATNNKRLKCARCSFKSTYIHILSAWIDCRMCGFLLHNNHLNRFVVKWTISYFFFNRQTHIFVSCFASLEFNQMKSKCQLYVCVCVYVRMRCWCFVSSSHGCGAQAQLCTLLITWQTHTFDFIIYSSFVWHRIPNSRISSPVDSFHSIVLLFAAALAAWHDMAWHDWTILFSEKQMIAHQF